MAINAPMYAKTSAPGTSLASAYIATFVENTLNITLVPKCALGYESGSQVCTGINAALNPIPIIIIIGINS